MKQFQYVAQSSAGQKKTGEVQGENKKKALDILQKKGLLIVELKLAKKFPKISTRLRADFTRRLHLLLQSGLPIYESLQFLHDQAAHKEKEIYQLLMQNVLLGKQFSTALQEMHFFEPL